MTEKTIQLKSKKVESFETGYFETGNPAEQTIVMFHDGGFGTTAELCWSPVAQLLGEKFHVVAPDLLGWGRTDKAVFLDRSPYAGRLAHMTAFVRELGIENPVLVGASFGGSLALRAVADPTNPLNASAVVSVSGSGGPYRLRGDELADYTPSLEAAARLTGMLVSSASGLDDHIRQRYENSLAPGHWEAQNAPRLTNPSVKRQLPQDPFAEQMAVMNVPVLLVEGKKDTLLETGWSERTAAHNPAKISTLVTEYSHEPNIEAPAFTAELIANFIAEQGGDRA